MSVHLIGRLAAGTLAAALAVLASAVPACAMDRRAGFQECNANRRVSVSSTTGSSSDFHVLHSVGMHTQHFFEPGYHSWISPASGGHWEIRSSGVIVSGGAGCA